MNKEFFIGTLLFLLYTHNYKKPAFTTNQIHHSKDTFIDIGDHKLHFVITKAEEPTILLEAGGGADASQWVEIQENLAKQTNATIISYDRAGYGKSELPNNSYDIKREVQDLNTCLNALGAHKIILVGHSYGAFLNQAYQFMHPENIEAIILADPNNITFVDSVGVRILIRIPFDTTKALTISQKADVRQTIALPNTVETLRGMPFSSKIPMTVISAGKDWWPFPQWNRWWKNSHQSMVNASQNRKLLKAEGSAHNIPKERPDVIINAIIEMLKN